MGVPFYLTDLSCSCALGRTNDEVRENALSGSADGMVLLSSEVPGRTIRFGLVPGPLPEISDAAFRFRTNQLLALAVANRRAAFDAFISKYGPDRIGIVLGSSNTGVDEIQREVERWLSAGVKPDGFSFSYLELGTPAEFLKRLLGVSGPSYVISTACSSSAKAFAAARRLIQAGVIDAAIVGGVDGRCRFAMNGFHALGALASDRTNPMSASRDGINLGEGVALFTMETEGGGVRFAGAGETSDAWHATAPDPEGRGAEAAMRAALADAALPPEAVDCINLHGTGTHANDAMEAKAVYRVFGSRPFCVSTKPLTGHCLGAAGAVEAALGWLSLTRGGVPPHVSEAPFDPELPSLRLSVPDPSLREIHPRCFLSNSFAFGGSNAAILLTASEAS